MRMMRREVVVLETANDATKLGGNDGTSRGSKRPPFFVDFAKRGLEAALISRGNCINAMKHGTSFVLRRERIAL